MKFQLGVFVVIALLLQNQHVNAVSINDILNRIAKELVSIQGNTKQLQAEIKSKVDERKYDLNGKLTSLRSDILAGSSDCYSFQDRVNSIEKALNAPDSFKGCEQQSYFEKLEKSREGLTQLSKQAVDLMAMCALPGFDCQSSIDTMWSGLEIIHKDIEITMLTISNESGRCIAGKATGFGNDVYYVRNAWAICNNSN